MGHFRWGGPLGILLYPPNWTEELGSHGLSSDCFCGVGMGRSCALASLLEPSSDHQRMGGKGCLRTEDGWVLLENLAATLPSGQAPRGSRGESAFASPLEVGGGGGWRWG